MGYDESKVLYCGTKPLESFYSSISPPWHDWPWLQFSAKLTRAILKKRMSSRIADILGGNKAFHAYHTQTFPMNLNVEHVHSYEMSSYTLGRLGPHQFMER